MTERIAWLGMYDHPAQQAANDRLWRAMAGRLNAGGIDAPPVLSRELSPHDAWSHPGLLFGQICSRPLREHHPTLRTIAHPDYAACAQTGRHRSHVIVHARSALTTIEQAKGARVAINDAGSNTGSTLLEALTGPLDRWASRVIETGSHRASLLAVGSGEADLASIDEVTLATLARYEPAAVARIRSIARTGAAPTPPFVTSARTPPGVVAALRDALDHVLAAPELEDARWVLGLSAFEATGSPRQRIAL